MRAREVDVKTDGERFVEVAGMIVGKRLTYKKLTGKEQRDDRRELEA